MTPAETPVDSVMGKTTYIKIYLSIPITKFSRIPPPPPRGIWFYIGQVQLNYYIWYSKSSTSEQISPVRHYKHEPKTPNTSTFKRVQITICIFRKGDLIKNVNRSKLSLLYKQWVFIRIVVA